MTRLAVCSLLMLALATGCEALVDLVPVPEPVTLQPPFELRPVRAPAKPKSVDDQLAAFPSAETLRRDPFLTRAENEWRRTGRRVEEPKPLAVKSGRPGPKRGGGALQTLRKRAESVEAFLTGPNGERIAVVTGMPVKEGDTFDEYVVVGVAEDGIRLRLRTGTGSEFIPFKRKAVSDWDFNSNDAGEAPQK